MLTRTSICVARNRPSARAFLCLALVASAAKAQTIASDLKSGYQVVAADLNGDGKTDLLVVDSGSSELAWYENPSWQRHTIAGGFSHLINAAILDRDEAGVPEIAVASGFSQDYATSEGVVTLLHRRGDPRELWSAREIDRLPTSHRLRWADLLGNGQCVLINAPLLGANRGAAPLVFYRAGKWKRETIPSANRGIQHGIFVDGHDLLTASDSGIHRYRWENGAWQRREVARQPSSDVTTISGGVATIQPWHGNTVAAYQPDRRVLDESLNDGHTILSVAKGVVAGYRGKGGGLLLYTPPQWKREVIEMGQGPVAACAAFDEIQIVCIGGSRLWMVTP